MASAALNPASGAAGRTPDGIAHPDPDDLGAIVDAALPRILGYILLRVSDRATAEELTQETMLALARAVGAGGPRIADPLAWLFGTARFKVIDHYRARSAALPLDPLDGADAAELPAPGDDFERVLAREELAALLERVPERQRLALLLHYGDGLPVAEVATAMAISEHAVESLLARGRRTLRGLRATRESES